MSEFKRGIENTKFIRALEALAASDNWWRDIIRDKRLLIGIRNEYLNVYWRGQSIFRVTFDRRRSKVCASTHPKYLLDPNLSGQVYLENGSFDISSLQEPMIVKYSGPQTLRKMIKAAERYAGDEKSGVRIIGDNNSSVVDVEIELPEGARLDIATIKASGDGAKLVFWEAKLFSNPELRAQGEPPVVSQIRRYRELLNKHRNEVVGSYHHVAKNLVQLAKMSEGNRRLDPLIERVGRGLCALTMSPSPEVGLLVYKFDQDQATGGVWKRHLNKLVESLGDDWVQRQGDVQGMRI